MPRTSAPARAARARDRPADRLRGSWSGVNLASLTRVKDFAWPRFFQVGKWALLAYVFIAGLIEYAFLQNHVRGGPLVILTLSLLVYAVQVPALIAFTVARYDDSSAVGADGSLAPELNSAASRP